MRGVAFPKLNQIASVILGNWKATSSLLSHLFNFRRRLFSPDWMLMHFLNSISAYCFWILSMCSCACLSFCRTQFHYFIQFYLLYSLSASLSYSGPIPGNGTHCLWFDGSNKCSAWGLCSSFQAAQIYGSRKSIQRLGKLHFLDERSFMMRMSMVQSVLWMQ